MVARYLGSIKSFRIVFILPEICNGGILLFSSISWTLKTFFKVSLIHEMIHLSFSKDFSEIFNFKTALKQLSFYLFLNLVFSVLIIYGIHVPFLNAIGVPNYKESSLTLFSSYFPFHGLCSDHYIQPCFSLPLNTLRNYTYMPLFQPINNVHITWLKIFSLNRVVIRRILFNFRTYDPDKDYERMKKAGVFTSIKQDGTVNTEGW